ncbi:c-type cytochrome [Aquimarina megaterium]|uniref:c-type cytochrome n=1 Tax=Aquimarina megaterium TaxID=1443666 RepID=UPI0004726F0C|nr:cytochrome c [Aquimarina megaterium]
MESIFKKISILLITLLCFNCSSGDDSPQPNPNPDPDTNPNPNKITTYDADVKAIIDAQCVRCHTVPAQNGAPFPMRNYTETIVGVNRDLVLLVKSTGANVMPPEGRLPQATIDIILDWEADGFLEK